MKGDFTRSTFRPEKHYTSVRLQQGRVQLDADWNEQIDIQRYQQQAMQAAFLGASGAPKVGGGFAITATTTASSPDLAISPGRFYANGLLCELPAGVTYSTQPDYPGAPKLSSLAAGAYIVYLDVWTRHVTSIEDPLIREVALAGPDTTTRTQTVAQVKLQKLPAAIAVLDAIDLSAYIPTSNLRLAARAYSASGQPGTLAPPGSGYLRLDNHLYRVEIHQGGKLGTDTVTYKWSRENASIVTPWIDGTGSTLTVGPIGHEEERGFAVGGWVEITDDGRELRGEPGVLCQVTRFEGSSLTVSATVNRTDFPQNPRIRRWEMVASAIPALTAAQANGTTWLPLEDGVQIAFTGDTCRSGDHWVIPARTATRDVEWPQQAGAPAFVLRHGDVHHLVDIAQLEWTGTALTANKLFDRRFVFAPLVDFRAFDPQTWDSRMVTHKHTGDADGSQIPRGGIVNNAVDGTKIDPASNVALNTLTVGGTGVGALTIKGSTKQTGAEFHLDARSNVTDGSIRRALTHDASGDILIVNNSGDYSGGMKIGGSKIDVFPGTNPLHITNYWDASWLNELKSACIINEATGTFKSLMLIGNRGNTSTSTPRKVTVWDNLEVNGHVSVTNDYRNVRRALVHDTNDSLTINYGNDYSGNVKIGSSLTVGGTASDSGRLTLNGTDFSIDNTEKRGGRSGTGRRALVHAENDRLVMNYDNDYTSGVHIAGQVSIGSRSTLNDNTLYLRKLTDGNHGLGHFGDYERYFAGKTFDGPALYGYSGGALGTANLPGVTGGPNTGLEGALALAGSGYVSLPEMNDDFSDGFSLEAWVWWDYKTVTATVSTMPSYTRVFDMSSSAGTGFESVLLCNVSTTRSLAFSIKGPTANGLLTATLTDGIDPGAWTHICVTIKGNTLVMYKNGVAQSPTISGTVAVPATRNRQNCYIGKSAWSTDDTFYGRIAQVRLWKRALTADQVSDHYGSARPIDPASLVGWWRLTDGSARDFSGLKRHGTLQGGNTTNAFVSYQKAALTWDSSNNVEVIGKLKTGNVRASANTGSSTVYYAPMNTYTDIDGMTQSFTLTQQAQCLFLAVVGGVQSESSASVRGVFKIVLVKSDSTYVDLAKSVQEFQTTGGYHLRDVTMHALATVEAGTYSVKVQWFRDTSSNAGTNGGLGCGWHSSTRRVTVIEL